MLAIAAPQALGAPTSAAYLPCLPAGSAPSSGLSLQPRPKACLIRRRHQSRSAAVDLRKLNWFQWGQPEAVASARLHATERGADGRRPSERVAVGADKLVSDLCTELPYYSRLRIATAARVRTLWLASRCDVLTYQRGFRSHIHGLLQNRGARDDNVGSVDCSYGAPGRWRCSADASWQQPHAGGRPGTRTCEDEDIRAIFGDSFELRRPLTCRGD